MNDTGSAYDLPVPFVDDELVRVGKGTPGGELLRRYWQPIAVAGEVKDLPVAVRVLGEDLVLFRTGSGRFGLVYPRCCHRGTTPLYPVEERYGLVFEGHQGEVAVEVRAAALMVPAAEAAAGS